MNRKGILTRLSWAVPVMLILMMTVFSGVSSGHDLKEIREAIKAQRAQWTAGDTSVSHLPLFLKMRRLGLNLPYIPPATAGATVGSTTGTSSNDTDSTAYGAVTAPLGATAPLKLDWRSYYGGNYVTPVRDQGNCGSCWAFATVAALESQALMDQDSPVLTYNASEQAVLSCSGAGDCEFGGYIDGASNFIRNTGTPPEACFPYTATSNSCANACADRLSTSSKITGWAWITTSYPTISALKNALFTYGPLVTTMEVYTDFYRYTGGIYKYVSGSYAGGHAVLIVGYDDYGQYFIVKNSWGTGWGESGYFKIAYSQLSSKVRFGRYTIAYKDFIGANTPSDPQPTVSISANPASIVKGQTSTITWSSTDATSVSITGIGTVGTSGSQTVSPTATTTYTATATGPGGTASQSVTITVVQQAPPPTVSISANPASIVKGQTSTITWSSTNATSVSITGIGTVGTSGSQTVSPTATTTYTATATGPGGTSSPMSVTVTVTEPAPTVTISANPASIVKGQTSTITWSSTNATSVSITGIGTVGTSGSQTVSPTSTTTYTATATGPGGTSSPMSVTVTVTEPSSCSYSISPTSAAFKRYGGYGTIKVAVTGTGCGPWTAISNVQWIRISAGTTGTVNGTVWYYVDYNSTGLQRSGTITVAGKIFTVTQSMSSW